MTSDKDGFKDFKGAFDYPSRNLLPNTKPNRNQNTQVDSTLFTLTQTSLSQISTFNPNKSTFLNQPFSPTIAHLQFQHLQNCLIKWTLIMLRGVKPRSLTKQGTASLKPWGQWEAANFFWEKWDSQQKLNMKILLYTNL